MRTTLDISQDVLFAAKEMAARNNTSMGEVISDLARKSLNTNSEQLPTGFRNGFPLLPATGKAITSEFIKALMDEE